MHVQFDVHYETLDIVSWWPGSHHDARILDESGLALLFGEHTPAGSYLLGDSDYPWKQWTLTPYSLSITCTKRKFSSLDQFGFFFFSFVEGCFDVLANPWLKCTQDTVEMNIALFEYEQIYLLRTALI